MFCDDDDRLLPPTPTPSLPARVGEALLMAIVGAVGAKAVEVGYEAIRKWMRGEDDASHTDV